jgi:hypothetical protein
MQIDPTVYPVPVHVLKPEVQGERAGELWEGQLCAKAILGSDYNLFCFNFFGGTDV